MSKRPSGITLRTNSRAQTQQLAAALAELAVQRDLLLILGDLGAGKTAFVQGFGAGLGVREKITSPTFALVQSYPASLRMHHLDVYRLGHVSEAYDLGLEELLDDEAVTLIEWGDTILQALPNDYLEVRITAGVGDDDRELEVSVIGRSWRERMGRIAEALKPWQVEDADGEPQC